MSNDKLQLICRCCDTIFDVCTMPTDIDAVVKAINGAKCPTCDTSGRTAHLYVGVKEDEKNRAGMDAGADYKSPENTKGGWNSW